MYFAFIFENVFSIHFSSYENNIAKAAFPSDALIIFTYFKTMNLISRTNFNIKEADSKKPIKI